MFSSFQQLIICIYIYINKLNTFLKIEKVTFLIIHKKNLKMSKVHDTVSLKNEENYIEHVKFMKVNSQIKNEY